MCVSAKPAKFASTIVYGRAAQYRGQMVHVLGYQNKAHNRGSGPNAMLLPIPSAAPMGPDNAIDARAFSGVLEVYREALRTLTPAPRSASAAHEGELEAGSVQVFDSGSYTIVLAHRAELEAIETALARVPVARRPTLSPELIDAYRRWYPGWHLALCCFATDVGAEPEPMLWWYPPLDPARVFLPGLDAHDGCVPQLGVAVELDHSVALGVDHELPKAEPARSTSAPGIMPWRTTASVERPSTLPASLLDLFPAKVAGAASMSDRLENGDWYLPAQPDTYTLHAALRQRQRPPGA